MINMFRSTNNIILWARRRFVPMLSIVLFYFIFFILLSFCMKKVFFLFLIWFYLFVYGSDLFRIFCVMKKEETKNKIKQKERIKRPNLMSRNSHFYYWIYNAQKRIVRNHYFCKHFNHLQAVRNLFFFLFRTFHT